MSRCYNLEQIIIELITTEQNYVQDLQDISQVYLPCFSILNNVSGDDVDTVFGNIESILHISKNLLHDLVSADRDLIKIAECFLDRASDFHQYSAYCTGYHRANERVLELKQKNPFLATILNDLQRSLGHSLPLTSYLHKPVQRILKYHLILKNLLKNVEDSSDAVSYLLEAYESMAKCAEDINNCKRLKEMDVKTRELHELLLAIRETQHFGKLIREGEMTLDGGGSSAKVGRIMFMYLFENVLVLCHKINDVFALHTILRCSELLILEDNTRKELDFTLVPFSAPSHCITLRAKTLAQKLDWCIQLHKLTDHNIPSKAKKLLLSNNNSNQEDVTKTHKTEKNMKRSISITSPTSLGRRVKRHLRSSVNGILTKSKSAINLRRSSSSTSTGSSSFLRSYDSAFDSMSLKSDASCSSDQLSSLSSQLYGESVSSPLTESHPQSYDDSSDYVRKLYENIDTGNVSHWHHQLSSRIYRFCNKAANTMDAPERSRKAIRRSKSCIELTNSNTCGDEGSFSSPHHSRCNSAIQKVARSSKRSTAGGHTLTRNLFEAKGHFLQKVLRWQRRANTPGFSTIIQESVTPTEEPLTIKPQCYGCNTVCSHESSYNCDNSSAYSCEELREDEEEPDELGNSVFKVNISDDFSDSLIECFNNVLHTTSAV